MSTGNSRDSILARLGMTTPIVQAPMAGVSTPAMAAAVSNAGGLGSLGVGAMNAATAQKTLRETRALTGRPINVNVFCHPPSQANAAVESAWLRWLAPQFAQYDATPPASLAEIYTSFVVDEAMLKVFLEEKPAVVSFHFGLPPASFIEALKAAGIVLFASATSLDDARASIAAGADAIVAQGIEAGGHRGAFDLAARDDGLGTFALTRLFATRLDRPVIAAGGIMDGAGIAAALALGAQAAQLGTAFVGCPESAIDAGYRRALLGDGPRNTILTSAISGRPARSLANRFTEHGLDASRPATPDYPVTYDAGKALHAAAKAKGEFGYGAQWAGQAAALAREVPAGELVGVLDREMREAIARLRGIAD